MIDEFTLDASIEYLVLNIGFVRLDDCMADDLSVVNSARVSFGMRHEDIEEGDDKLIGFLLKNRHGTPFEHNSFRFHVKAPIFVFREWQRHRMGSFNELSARYKKLEGEWYIPEVKNVRVRVGKPGHYTYEPAPLEVAQGFVAKLQDETDRAFYNYELALEDGIAPELARCHLPVSMYSQMYWTVNARSLMNFLSLRNAPTAQFEIREYAKVVEGIFATAMPLTHAAFDEYGRLAP